MQGALSRAEGRCANRITFLTAAGCISELPGQFYRQRRHVKQITLHDAVVCKAICFTEWKTQALFNKIGEKAVEMPKKTTI